MTHSSAERQSADAHERGSSADARSIVTAPPGMIELATFSVSDFGHRGLRDAAHALADRVSGDRGTVSMGHASQHEGHMKAGQKIDTLLDLCVSSLRRGHANLLCIVPILTDDPRRESNNVSRSSTIGCIGVGDTPMRMALT